MTIPRLLDLIDLSGDVRGQRVYEYGLGTNYGMNDPKHLDRLLGPKIEPSKEQLMQELPLPADYFDSRNGGDK